jgi:hypothetical protein
MVLGFGLGTAISRSISMIGNGTKELYRGDGRGPEDIFKNGMTARNPGMSLEEHLAGGSGLISTSRSKFVANGFAVQHKGYTYVIDDIGTGNKVKYPKGFKGLQGETEVNFASIPSSQIKGAYNLQGEYIPNPNYGKK